MINNLTRALQNSIIFVNSYRNDYTILAKLTKRLWRLICKIFTIIISKNGDYNKQKWRVLIASFAYNDYDDYDETITTERRALNLTFSAVQEKA
jgi:hypothetical protein